jgi:hypothetical protein
MKAKDEYFYRNMRAKPEINQRSRRIARSISALGENRYGMRPWAQKSKLGFTT